MLPFLEPKKVVSLLIAKRKPDGSHEMSHEAGDYPPEAMDAAQMLISAVHAKDAKAVCEAFSELDEALEACEPKVGDVEGAE